MSYKCYVLKEKEPKIKHLYFKDYIKFKTKPFSFLTLKNLKKLEGFLYFDIRKSVDYCKSRLKDSVWLNRSNIEKCVPKLCKNIVLISDNVPKASLIVKDLSEKYPEIQVKVYHWNEKEIKKFPEYLEHTKINIDKKFIDFNFHTYMRHEGNKEHAKQYLKWEIDLLEKMDKEEINFFT
jgi:hypothetical protein